MPDLLSRRVLLFGGKGGVGKTTCASAVALGASRLGRRVLLVSTDPAHSTSDIFGVSIGPEAREILPRLFALELDAEVEVRRHLDRAKAGMAGVFRPAVVKEAARQIELTASMPGVADVAVFERMIDLVLGERDRFDLVIFDTAPTGHALRLLTLPESMGAWVAALAARRGEAAAAEAASGAPAASPKPDPVLAMLEQRLARVRAIEAELKQRERVAFVLVLVPESLPIHESARAAHALEDAGIHVALAVVNRVLPAEAEGSYFAARKAQERLRLDEIENRLSPIPRVFVPQLASDVRGVESLERVGACLLADSRHGE